MSGLWRKEFRLVRPFLGLVLVVIIFGLLDECFSGLANAQPMALAYDSYIAVGRFGAVICFVLVFAMASGLLVREHDEGTMEFLDSLPVSRTRMFLVKVAMAMLVVCLLVVLDVATGVLLHALSRNSLDPTFHWPFVITATILRCCQLFIVLCLGLALSFLRRFGWLVLGLVFWVYIFLHEWIPSIAVLDLFALGEPRFEGDRWIVPERQLIVQLGLAAICLAVAYGLFLGAGDLLVKGLQRLTRSRLGNAVLLIGAFFVVIACGALVVRFMEQEVRNDSPDEDDNGVTVTYPSWTTSRTRTDHFEFLYPTNLTSRARRLADGSDQAFRKVQDFFDAEPGERIVVDATSILPRHAGVAYWNKIRLDLGSSEHLETQLSILGHETCHVFLERLSDSRLGDQMNSTRFFHEGVASYVEYHLFDPKPGLAKSRSVAAVMHARGEVYFNELVDNQTLSRRRDTNLVYPLGEVFAAAMIKRHGKSSVGKVVRALVREDAPKGLDGLPLWRDVFQACDYNLDSVVDEFYATLDQEVKNHQKLIDALPRLRGVFRHDDDLVYISVDSEPVDDWRLVCRLRQDANTPNRQYLYPSDANGMFIYSRDAFPGASLWYQIGLVDDHGRAIFEPWRQVTLD